MDDNDHKYKHLTLKLTLAAILVGLAVAVTCLNFVPGCSVQGKKKVLVQAPPPPDAPDTPPVDPNNPPKQPPPEEPPPDEQKECDKVVTFDELQPVIALNCAGCHQGRDSYAQASAKLDEMIASIKVKAGQPNHMPAGRPDLSDKDIALFDAWKADGKLKAGECKGTTSPNPQQSFYDFAWLEGKLTDDISLVSQADQPNIRWLIAVDLLNMGLKDQLLVARDAAAKSINSVSVKPDLQNPLNVAPGIWRINIDDLGIEQPDWQAIEQATQLNFESFTQRGALLKAITKSRLPWMFVDDFNDTVLRNASVYYRLTEAPATLQALLKKLNVNFAGDLADFKATLIGFNGSALSPAANRLMSRHDSDDGYFWATYDTGPIVSQQQNLFTNPLLIEAGGKANLKFAAGEQLYSLPNGMMASFLANAAGTRLNEADPNVVHDFTSNPVSPIIKNAISCFRCHNGGLIHATDQVRAAVPNSNIGADDIQRALALFKPQTTVDAFFQKDNNRFAAAAGAIAVSVTEPDPISRISDPFLGDWNLARMAGKLILRPEDLETCINLSAKGSQQAGQVLKGGSISHDQFVQVARDLLRDCRIFQDPLSQ